MKRIIIIIILSIINICSILSQDHSLFYDAVKIAEELKAYREKPSDKSMENIIAILSRYSDKKSYKDNKFIFENLPQEIQQIGIAQSESRMSISTVSTPSVTPFNATIFADAFAKIIVKRFKQDMNELFFNRLKQDMDNNIELKTVFPKTYAGLSLIDKDVYNLNTFIDGLRDKMEEDLGNVFANTNELLQTTEYQEKFRDNQTLGAFMSTAIQLTDGLIQHKHPGLIIDELRLNEAYSMTTDGTDIQAGLQTIRLFSNALRSNKEADDTYWVKGLNELNLLFSGEDALATQIWLGLIYQLAVDEKGNDIKFGNGTTLKSYINKLYNKQTNFFEMRNYTKGLIARVNQIQNMIVVIQESKTKNTKVNWQQVAAFYENTISLIKYVPTIKYLTEKESALHWDWQRGIYVAETLPNIYAEMSSRQYHAAIQHFIEVIKAFDGRKMRINAKIDVAKNTIFFEDKKGENPIRNFSNLIGKYVKDINGNIVAIKYIEVRKDDGQYEKLSYRHLEQFLKRASFCASLALATNSDEVSRLLEATMLPPGTTRTKVNSFTIGINSFLAYQKIYVPKTIKIPIVGISAPIGLNFSFGWKEPQSRYLRFLPKNAQTLISPFDVGAFAGFRLKNDEVEMPKVKLDNFYAPGIFINTGRWFNTPLNVGFGLQKPPSLIKLSSSGQVISTDYTKWAFNVSMSWDIPFWNLSRTKWSDF